MVSVGKKDGWYMKLIWPPKRYRILIEMSMKYWAIRYFFPFESINFPWFIPIAAFRKDAGPNQQKISSQAAI